MTRNEARENMMQIIYELDASKTMTEENASKLTDERLVGNHKKRGCALLCGIIENIEHIDNIININSNSWKTTRMPKVDVAIMRLALGEIFYCDDIPTAVSINEAINLAKKYSTEQSSRFIHGVLGAAIKSNEK